MSRRYAIPDFKIDELIKSYYGRTFTDTGSGIYCHCPYTEHKTPGSKGTFRVYPENGTYGTAVCPCGVRGTVWDILAEYEGLPPWGSDDFDETVLWVYRALGREPILRANVPVSERDLVKELYQGIAKRLAPIHFSQANEHYQPADKGWTYRGVSSMVWFSHGVGMLPPAALTELEQLHKPHIWSAAGLKPWKGSGRAYLTQGIVVIRRNENGSPVGLAVRRYPTNGQELFGPKYVKNASNALMDNSDYVFGLYTTRRRKGHTPPPYLYVTEGEFDTLSLHLRGVYNTVTHGSGQPSSSQMETIAARAEHNVFLLDADPEQQGFQHGVEIARKATNSTHFAFIPLGPNGQKSDPDLFMQTHSPSDLLALPRFTRLQMLMIDTLVDGRWPEPKRAYLERFMRMVIENPSAEDEPNVAYLAQLSETDEAYLRSWLFQARNHAALHLLASSSDPLRLT